MELPLAAYGLGEQASRVYRVYREMLLRAMEGGGTEPPVATALPCRAPWWTRGWLGGGGRAPPRRSLMCPDGWSPLSTSLSRILFSVLML
jgi:hypothetical protein